MNMYTSISGVVKSAMFPSSVCTLGVSLTHAIGNELFGAPAEYIALKLKKIGHELIFYFYITDVIIIALITLLFVPDMNKEDIQDDKPL